MIALIGIFLILIIDTDEIITISSRIINNYCTDNTEIFIEGININKNATLKDAEFVDINGQRYYRNNKNKVIHEFNEEEVGKWIQKKLHKDTEYLLNISEDDSVKLGDYKVDDKEIWELKTIKGNGKRTLDSAIKDKKGQASIFIFDLTYSEMKDMEAIRQAILVFRNRDWVTKIILKRNENIIKVFIKKEIDYGSQRS